jgi:hypothetical protein
VQKIKQQERRAGTAARGPPKPRTPKTEVGAKDPPKKAARGSLKLCAPKTPVGSKDRPKKAQKASVIAHVLHSPPPPRAQLCKRSCSNKHTHTSETDACQSVLPPAGSNPAAHADALGPGGKRSRDPGGGVSAGALSRARRSMFNLSARTSGARTSGRERDAPIVQSRCKFICTRLPLQCRVDITHGMALYYPLLQLRGNMAQKRTRRQQQ